VWPKRFDAVWLSTPAHLQAWERLFYDRAGRPIPYTAATIPPRFPHVRPFWGLFPQAIPIVYLASGVLTLDEEHIRFEPREYRFLGNKHVGLLEDPAFDLATTEVRARERYVLKSPVAEVFDMTFARLSTSRPGTLSELLLAVGLTGLNMRKAKRRNTELLSALVPE
jgi:hypothetical protein